MEIMVRKLNYKFWKGKKVFVTGHTGFKGSWMISWLLKLGAEVKGYSLTPDQNNYLFSKISNHVKSDISESYGNILDKAFLNKSLKEFKPDIIYHFAAQPLVRKSYEEPLLTWQTNVIGTLNILDSINKIDKECTVIIITTDKVYKNKEWFFSYRENDELGGHDPYSASKAACEIAVSSWRSSFEDNNNKNSGKKIASVRAGNVIGGGDWAVNRIVPDVIKSLISSKKVLIRNPKSKRPWQHVLEPLKGYLFLAETVTLKGKNYCQSYNFGPNKANNKTVKDLVEKIFMFWPGEWMIDQPKNNYHEAKLLNLQVDKAEDLLDWHPLLSFEKTIEMTVRWYKNVHNGNDSFKELFKDIEDYEEYKEF